MTILFTTTACGVCKQVKQYMLDKKISFMEKNTDTDHQAMAELVAEGLWTAPVLKYEDKYYAVRSVIEVKQITGK